MTKSNPSAATVRATVVWGNVRTEPYKYDKLPGDGSMVCLMASAKFEGWNSDFARNACIVSLGLLLNQNQYLLKWRLLNCVSVGIPRILG
jgi:hypothetical protein